VLAVATSMVREEGWRVAFKGIGAAGVRAFVVNSVIFTVRPACHAACSADAAVVRSVLCTKMKRISQLTMGWYAGLRGLRGSAVTGLDTQASQHY
jgi:hypothetical protein